MIFARLYGWHATKARSSASVLATTPNIFVKTGVFNEWQPQTQTLLGKWNIVLKVLLGTLFILILFVVYYFNWFVVVVFSSLLTCWISWSWGDFYHLYIIFSWFGVNRFLFEILCMFSNGHVFSASKWWKTFSIWKCVLWMQVFPREEKH